jgi:hypothetical protein
MVFFSKTFKGNKMKTFIVLVIIAVLIFFLCNEKYRKMFFLWFENNPGEIILGLVIIGIIVGVVYFIFIALWALLKVGLLVIFCLALIILALEGI